MKNKSLQTILRSPKTVFSFQDLALLWQSNNVSIIKSRISRFVRQGDIHHIGRGLYAKDPNYNKLELATHIFTPSYVSFETVLAQEGLIFQYYPEIFVASYLTRSINVDGQMFTYKKIKDTVLTDPLGVNHLNQTSIANKERAFLDALYIHQDYHFDNLESLDWDQVFLILPIYQNKRLIKVVNKLFKQTKL